jgi:hypothetical protein
VALTCLDSSLPSSGSFLDTSELLEIQIEWVVYHIMCGYVTCVPDCRAIRYTGHVTTVQEAEFPEKNLVRHRCAEGFNYGVKGLKYACACQYWFVSGKWCRIVTRKRVVMYCACARISAFANVL